VNAPGKKDAVIAPEVKDVVNVTAIKHTMDVDTVTVGNHITTVCERRW